MLIFLYYGFTIIIKFETQVSRKILNLCDNIEWSQIRPYVFLLTTASKLLFDTMFQIRYEMKERYLLNIGNSCKGGIKSLSSLQCIYPPSSNLRYTGSFIIIM